MALLWIRFGLLMLAADARPVFRQQRFASQTAAPGIPTLLDVMTAGMAHTEALAAFRQLQTAQHVGQIIDQPG
jgi:hypothetical protein